ncbi:DAO-domain-containing protein [Suhomyces tanzawaensis NRRL Y-17324]|uniref:DAO-domain-containing protein n=1 Tax=Suhomyces tanzawaensis NRRL Y-17324 TaxID=984487 RepID=A0A1E4SNC1_9ASCO|nr:DAO-domain-containing protein [Suhomyces tanzawaensis NRRL Y-17324]ODV80988.1 DAO-domain-containing protein [Suhomyces tanzawaensis NRRL Y-17324]
MTDYLKFRTESSGRHKGKHHIIIVGAGIIGVCTAYYLVHHPKFDPEKYHITIVESKRVAGGASGKAGGLLALWAFPQEIVPLSFQLHQELSDQYNGEEEWGYRRLNTVSLEGDISHLKDLEEEDEDNDEDDVQPETFKQSKRHDSDSSSSLARDSTKTKAKLPETLNWITESLISECSTLGGTDTTAQVHPYKFTTFILKKAVEKAHGAIELIIGKVNEIVFSMETGRATGVAYQPTSVKSSVSSKHKSVKLKGNQIVLSVGPWTSKILPDCPISGLRAHSITVSPFKDQPVSPYAIFTEFKTGSYSYISPEIYARQDEVYVCGEGDSAVDVPETTDDVEVVKSKCDELFKQVGKISPNLRRGHILKKQACYLPVLDVPSSSGPLIGETNVESLFLASGHSCWGINNAPGTGKIMSELLLDGASKSADTSGLDPSLYFDASVLVSDDEDNDNLEDDIKAAQDDRYFGDDDDDEEEDDFEVNHDEDDYTDDTNDTTRNTVTHKI